MRGKTALAYSAGTSLTKSLMTLTPGQGGVFNARHFGEVEDAFVRRLQVGDVHEELGAVEHRREDVLKTIQFNLFLIPNACTTTISQ